jgi:hypothetical protein
MAGRDDVIRVESVDVEVGRLPALSQKTTGFAGVQNPRFLSACSWRGSFIVHIIVLNRLVKGR